MAPNTVSSTAVGSLNCIGLGRVELGKTLISWMVKKNVFTQVVVHVCFHEQSANQSFIQFSN